MSDDLLIKVRGLGKEFRIYSSPWGRVGEWLSGGRKKRHASFWALKDVSFDLPRGSSLGVVGANGAGKSTLLRIINGASPPTLGTVEVRGRLGSLLELGAGFHPGFTGRQNIYMNAAIMGIGRREVLERFREVADFADLGAYLDRPLRTYSSGMSMRLGFAVAMLARPEILILDEVFAVGDASFQKKCVDRIRRMREEGTSLLFVSHSLYHVRQVCDRAIYLRQGRVIMEGDPISVTDEYQNYESGMVAKANADRTAKDAKENSAAPKDPSMPQLGELSITKADGQHSAGNVFETGQEVEFHLEMLNPSGKGRYVMGIVVTRNDDVQVFVTRSSDQGIYGEGERMHLTMRARLPLLAGEFVVNGYLLDESCDLIIEQRIAWGRFKMRYQGIEKGVILLEADWSQRGVQVP